MINVTKPTLPPLEEFTQKLEEIWASGVLSNQGPFHNLLEQSLSAFLGVPHISLVCNATIGLMLAQKALNVVGGEVITTPYTFVATTNSIIWMNNTPVFVDIEDDSVCMNPDLVEAAITERTRAIMPLHCYGNLVRVDDLDQIAKKNGVPVIYDACHSFSVEDEGGSALRHGDISVVSFHATKVFNTLEGGMIVSPNEDTKRLIDSMKNFGIKDETSVADIGINGKLNEVSAAFGLLQLKYVEDAINARSRLDSLYRERLRGINGINVIEPVRQIRRNCAYFPIRVTENFRLDRDTLFSTLSDNGIHGRRYFYPLIPDLSAYRDNTSGQKADLSVAKRVAKEIICLPLYPDLLPEHVNKICDIIAAAGA